MLAAVKTRLEAQVTALRSVGRAAQFAALVKSNSLPQQTPAAILLPLGIRARSPSQLLAGAFAQATEELVGIIVVIRTTDPSAAALLDDLEGLRDAVIAALAGWAPGDTVGVFELRRAALAGMQDNIVTYQIEMAITDQLRINT